MYVIFPMPTLQLHQIYVLANLCLLIYFDNMHFEYFVVFRVTTSIYGKILNYFH